jgi:hypothetical protein
MIGNARFFWLMLASLLSLPSACIRPIEHPSGMRPAQDIETIEQLWPDGTLRLRKQVLRQPDGTLLNHGTYVRWHENGREECRTHFRRGKKHGTSTLSHRNGKKWIEEHHDEGIRHGRRTVWDETGVKRQEEHFLKGKPHGTWTTWRADGEIAWKQSFEHGKPLP